MENLNLRKRKALLFLPIVIIPFLTLAFWALGGGKGDNKKPITDSGLNLQLPSAHLKSDRGNDKLSFYKIAEEDSERFRKEIKSDPLFQRSLIRDTDIFKEKSSLSFDPLPVNNDRDPNEEKVYQKLKELNKQLRNSGSTPSLNPISSQLKASVDGSNVDRLGGLMKTMGNDSSKDPEMEQLNSMMEKILDIQHPERVKASDKESYPPNNDFHFAVHKEISPVAISLLDTGIRKERESQFFGLEDAIVSTRQNAIEAVVHEDQILVSGAVIKLRLLDDININGKLISKDNFVFGIGELNGERLEVGIHSIRSGNSLYPVNMEVYDMDGLKGIYIPGAITRDVAKQSADNGLQTIEMSSLDPSIQAQAATAGINAAKTLISRKAKQIKVFVKAGYKILLKDKNTNL